MKAENYHVGILIYTQVVFPTISTLLVIISKDYTYSCRQGTVGRSVVSRVSLGFDRG